MCVLRRRSDVGMPQELLHNLKISSGPQDACSGCVAVVVKTVVQQLGVELGASPLGFKALTGHGISLASHASVAGLLGNIGEDEFWMITLQRKKHFADAGRNWNGAQDGSLAKHRDLSA